MRAIDAVTFDFWNTLMWEGPEALLDSRVAALLGVVEETGLPVDEAGLRSAHQVAFDRYQAEWRANRQFCVPDAVEVMANHLEIGSDPRLLGLLVDAFHAAGDDAELHLAEGVEACLHALHAAGTQLSIVCDIGLTSSPVLRRHLARRGLLDLFSSWAFSDEVGCYKPDQGIFQHALAGLKAIRPERAAHIGDRRRTDVAGAQLMGMLAVRYTGVYDDPDFEGPEADLVLDDYRRLPEALGLG